MRTKLIRYLKKKIPDVTKSPERPSELLKEKIKDLEKYRHSINKEKTKDYERSNTKIKDKFRLSENSNPKSSEKLKVGKSVNSKVEKSKDNDKLRLSENTITIDINKLRQSDTNKQPEKTPLPVAQKPQETNMNAKPEKAKTTEKLRLLDPNGNIIESPSDKTKDFFRVGENISNSKNENSEKTRYRPPETNMNSKPQKVPEKAKTTEKSSLNDSDYNNNEKPPNKDLENLLSDSESSQDKDKLLPSDTNKQVEITTEKTKSEEKLRLSDSFFNNNKNEKPLDKTKNLDKLPPHSECRHDNDKLLPSETNKQPEIRKIKDNHTLSEIPKSGVDKLRPSENKSDKSLQSKDKLSHSSGKIEKPTEKIQNEEKNKTSSNLSKTKLEKVNDSNFSKKTKANDAKSKIMLQYQLACSEQKSKYETQLKKEKTKYLSQIGKLTIKRDKQLLSLKNTKTYHFYQSISLSSSTSSKSSESE